MQIVIGVGILIVIAAVVALNYFGIAEVERMAARWLLRDARGWEARDAAKDASRAELAEVR